MGKRFVSKAAQCPYYKAQNRSVIVCEGLDCGTSVHVTFATPAERMEFQKQACKTLDYTEHCLLAKAHETKWTN